MVNSELFSKENYHQHKTQLYIISIIYTTTCIQVNSTMYYQYYYIHNIYIHVYKLIVQCTINT